MNRFLLVLPLLLVEPLWAQDAPAPAVQTPAIQSVPPVQTAPETLLTAESVRASQYIGAGLFDLITQDNQTLGTFKYVPEATPYDRLKGADDLRVRGFLLPPEMRAKIGQKLIAFVHFDGEAKRGRITGYLPVTDANVARVKELIAQNPSLEFHFSSDKKVYAVGEPVTVRLEVKNVSKAPLSIYTGQFAVQFDLKSGGGSTSVSDDEARTRPRTTTLGPGESWKYEQTYERPFAVGRLGLGFWYDGSDAFKSTRTLPSDLYLERARGEFDVEISPATTTQKAAISARLKSPRWDEQLDAAQKMLLSDDPADWKSLEPFATHPYEALRQIAGKAMFKSGTFSPALKSLLYSGTYLETYRAREPVGDLDLALLARAFVEDEAHRRGFVPIPIGYSPLSSLRDPRVGDLVAARLANGDPMQGGANNGAILNALAGTRETIAGADKPLSPEATAKVLAAWKAKRATVVKPFTQAQLDAEIALARKVGYNDFKVGPYYEQLVRFVDEGRKNSFGGAPQDVLNKELMALPPEAATDLMRVLEWRDVWSPPDAALRFIARSGDPKAFPFLAQIAYTENRPEGDARLEAVRLMGEMDYERAKTHLEDFFARPQGKWGWRSDAPRLGAALALAAHGEKRAVPVIFSEEFQQKLVFLDNEQGKALEGVTGQKFPNWTQWKRWWEREGSKQDWK